MFKSIQSIPKNIKRIHCPCLSQIKVGTSSSSRISRRDAHLTKHRVLFRHNLPVQPETHNVSALVQRRFLLSEIQIYRNHSDTAFITVPYCTFGDLNLWFMNYLFLYHKLLKLRFFSLGKTTELGTLESTVSATLSVPRWCRSDGFLSMRQRSMVEILHR